MQQRLLAIESATDWLSIALFEGDDPVLLREADGKRRHAAELMPMIAEAFVTAGWRLDDLEALAVSTGPGSFTSLRIGLATAKGLAFGRALRGVGVSTLEAMAWAAFEGGAGGRREEVLVVLDARRGHWYAGSWRLDPSGGMLRACLPEGLYDPARLAGDLARPVVALSPERPGWADGLRDAGLELTELIEGESARPRADRVARVARQALDRGEDVEVAALSARYLRRAEAEAVRLGGPVESGELARLDAKPR